MVSGGSPFREELADLVRMDANEPMITQERAYTSPIWYTP